MSSNKLKIQLFRENDLADDSGKQVEFGIKWCEFFEIDPQVGKISFDLIFMPLTEEHSALANKVIPLNLSELTDRNDRKAYSDNNGNSPIKNFFIKDLHLTERNKKKDYFAIYKSEFAYYLFYVPEILFNNFLRFFATTLPTVSVGINDIKSSNLDETADYARTLSPVILYGPPGTGKTNKMQNEYISKFPDKNRFLTTFHQSFSYEEFVEGLKPILSDGDDSGEIKYKVVDGIFKQACERAANMAGYASLNDCLEDTFENRKEKFDKAIKEHKTILLCIDEINRGNVAAIFGDLISLIETSKRLGADHELTAILPYSKITFGVPKNLLVVGTMNTADRSIQLLDSALRRRFKFEEIGPNYDVFGSTEVQQNAKKILQNINAKIRCLLNKDNQIGHSYFMFAKSYDDIYDALTKKIIPLLEEYFYNDVEKIRFVLSESGKNKNNNTFYVKDDEAAEAYKIYSKDNFDDEEKEFYSLRTERPNDCASFLKHLYETKKNETVDE
jgi:hypothetical protein